jgi:thiosulfate/3-mercaptopyruvate sulfurtransferase
MPQDETAPSLVSTDWLATHMTAPDVRIVDASWYLPQAGRNAREEYDQRHIEGAHFIDIDALSDPASAYPHMLPPTEMFASRMRKIGLGDGLRIIIYDGAGIYSAARVWWMFRVMGFKDIAVLDGGLPKWLAEGRPVTDEPPVLRDRHATARLDHTRLRDVTQVRGNIYSGKELLVDARSAGRFNGTEAEPRAGVRSGHVPGAVNLPFNLVLNEDGTMRAPDDLRAITKAAGIDLSKPITVMCGSGVTACVVALALEQIGHRRVAVYDGSWAEWGAQADLPIEV